MIDKASNCMVISGPLTVDTVAALANCDQRDLSGNEWTIDLGRVGAVDSAAVSLLLVWLRRAQRSNATLKLVNVPDNLVSLANLYGVAESLGI